MKSGTETTGEEATDSIFIPEPEPKANSAATASSPSATTASKDSGNSPPTENSPTARFGFPITAQPPQSQSGPFREASSNRPSLTASQNPSSSTVPPSPTAAPPDAPEWSIPSSSRECLIFISSIWDSADRAEANSASPTPLLNSISPHSSWNSTTMRRPRNFSRNGTNPSSADTANSDRTSPFL